MAFVAVASFGYECLFQAVFAARHIDEFTVSWLFPWILGIPMLAGIRVNYGWVNRTLKEISKVIHRGENDLGAMGQAEAESAREKLVKSK